MITITEDGNPVAHVELIGGKLKVEYLKPVQDIIEMVKEFRGRTLTDSEAYYTMPYRLTGRTAVRVSGPDADRLRDPSSYKAMLARADRDEANGRSE